MAITFEEALESFLNKIPDQTKELLGSEPAKEDLQDQIFELIWKHTIPTETAGRIKLSFQDGFGIIN